MKPDPWSMTFALMWYLGTTLEYIPIRIDAARVERGVPSVFA